MPYKNKICFGETDEYSIEVYDIQTREHIDSLNWDENQQYKSADDYIEDLLAENIDSECVSPKGNYTSMDLICCYIHLYIQRNLLIFWILRALADIHQCTNTKKEVRNTIYTIPTVRYS